MVFPQTPLAELGPGVVPAPAPELLPPLVPGPPLVPSSSGPSIQASRRFFLRTALVCEGDVSDEGVDEAAAAAPLAE